MNSLEQTPQGGSTTHPPVRPPLPTWEDEALHLGLLVGMVGGGFLFLYDGDSHTAGHASVWRALFDSVTCLTAYFAVMRLDELGWTERFDRAGVRRVVRRAERAQRRAERHPGLHRVVGGVDLIGRWGVAVLMVLGGPRRLRLR
jgi:hypothetical protein